MVRLIKNILLSDVRGLLEIGLRKQEVRENKFPTARPFGEMIVALGHTKSKILTDSLGSLAPSTVA